MGDIIKSSIPKPESRFPDTNIPEEIIVEILSRLPLDSLPRFTCVSKRWRSLISNIIITKTGSPKVLLICDLEAYSFSPHSIDQKYQHEVDLKSVHVPWNMSDPYYTKFKILGSCNGLVLLNIDEDLFLWNPFTKFFKKVLVSEDVRLDRHDRVCSGLCYDSTNDDYKAVLVYANQTPDYGDQCVKVGSFKSKSWKHIIFPYYVPTWDLGPTINGNIHWFASKKDSWSPHQIIYFDAQIDRFEEVPMPESRGEDGDILCGLGVLDGKLCMSRWDRPGNSESNIEVLVMKEYGVAKSWTILLLVSNRSTAGLYCGLAPLGYTKSGDVLTRMWMSTTWNNEVYDLERHVWAFNPTDNSRREISIPEDTNFFVIAHEDSLITPTDYGWEEEDQKGEATYVVYSDIYDY